MPPSLLRTHPSSTPFTMDPHICADIDALQTALVEIKSSQTILLDCEGHDLGQKGGSLSLISIRTTSAPQPQTYLIDVVKLNKDALRPLFDILESSSTTKVVFDGRMDYNELYHGFQVKLSGVVDLQLADVASRSINGEGNDERLARLSPYLHRREVMNQEVSYKQVQILCGLDRCVKDHKLADDGAATSRATGELPAVTLLGLIELTTTPVSVNHRYWLHRPLPEEYVKYAAQDLSQIELLYNHMKNEGFIDENLNSSSARYIAIWADARPRPTDSYRNNPLLPLEILNPDLYGLKRQCKHCERHLSKQAFSTVAWKNSDKRQCWVCRAIAVRNELHSGWDRDDDW